MNSFWRSWRRVSTAVVFLSSVIVMTTALTVMRADDHPTTNLRTDERHGIGMCSKTAEEIATILVYRIDSPSGTVYRMDEESAKDAAVAYALRDEVAIVTPERHPVDAVWVDECGSIIITRDFHPEHVLAEIGQAADMGAT